MSPRLDAIDRKILKELQDDGRMTNVELARRVGISAPPCLRRVRALEEAGFIKGYRGLLDEKLLGFEVTVFAMVHLSSQAEADLAAFEAFVRAQPIVRECWMLSGEIDFILKCVAPNLDGVSGLRRGADRRARGAQRQDVADAAQFEGRRDGAAGVERGAAFKRQPGNSRAIRSCAVDTIQSVDRLRTLSSTNALLASRMSLRSRHRADLARSRGRLERLLTATRPSSPHRPSRRSA